MSAHAQSGQAVVEGLVVLGVLSSLWLGVAWIGRLQDVALQAGHTSRYQAFALGHQAQVFERLNAEVLHGQSGYTRQGGAFLNAEATRSTAVQDEREPTIQIGGGSPVAAAARQDLQLGDSRVWVVSAHRQTAGADQSGTDLQNFDRHRLGIHRHTAIMRGSGAAVSDGAAQERLAQADSVWAHQARHSGELGERVSARMRAVDAAWGRADFAPDWLTPWTGWVPAQHLSTGGAP